MVDDLNSSVSSSTVKAEQPIESNDISSTSLAITGEQEGIITTAEEIPLSKKGKKRLLKAEIRKDAKKLRKDKDKEKKKSCNKSRNFRISSIPSTTHPIILTGDELILSRKERKESFRKEFISQCLKNFTVIIDLNWEEHHTEKALKSLKQQVMYCYGDNKRHTHPALIHLTGLGPLLTAQLVAQNHAENWIGLEMTKNEYLTLNNYSIHYDDSVKSGEKKQLVYLSSDAEENIDTLDVNCAYIIGGIVDRNKLKGITYKKAIEQGIRTAKLPIKENYELSATHILTVNHVFSILLNYGKEKDWKKAMEVVLPLRKGAKPIGNNGDYNNDNNENDDEKEDNDYENEDDEEEKDGLETEIEQKIVGDNNIVEEINIKKEAR